MIYYNDTVDSTEVFGMNLDALKNEWTVDSNIDVTDLSNESVRSMDLHAKYLSYLMDAKRLLKATDMKYHALKRDKFLYYRGEMDRDRLVELGWKQYQGAKPLRTDLDDLLKTDEDMLAAETKVEYYRIMVASLEEIMKTIASRQWTIRNVITWEQFRAGV